MQTRSNDKNSLCLSVCQAHDLWQNKKARILIPHERTFTLVLWQQEWLVGRPFLPEILGQIDPLERNRWFSVDIRS